MKSELDLTQLPNYQRIEVIAVVGALIFLVMMIEAIRRGRLKVRYSLLWFTTCGVVILLTIKRDWLDTISYLLGIHYPPSALFFILFGFIIIIIFHFSTVISRLLDDRTALAQRMALLEARLHRHQQAHEEHVPDEEGS